MENTQTCNYPAVDLGLEQMYSKAKIFTVSQCVRWAHIRENEEKYVSCKTEEREACAIRSNLLF